ncbi:MAG: hypothetical protein IKE22_04170 [Atopobiaceae bacterium]|nr:hypothetical protein [Atopobiaceae bacterium]
MAEVNGDFQTTWQTIPSGARFACMFSGGKDSGLALAKALEFGECVTLVHIIDGDVSLYHGQGREVFEAQSRAIGVPVECIGFEWWRDETRAAELMLRLKRRGVDTVVFGDLRAKYYTKGHAPMCERAGIRVCAPVCNIEYEYLMDDIERFGIKSLVTRINDSRIESHWLGMPFSREMYHHFAKLGIDSFGELGEFHTTLVDARFFKTKLRYTVVTKDKNMCRIILND